MSIPATNPCEEYSDTRCPTGRYWGGTPAHANTAHAITAHANTVTAPPPRLRLSMNRPTPRHENSGHTEAMPGKLEYTPCTSRRAISRRATATATQRPPRATGNPHGTAPHGTAPHGTAPHGTAPHGTAPHGTALTAPPLTAPPLTAPPLTAPPLTAPPLTAPPLTAPWCCSGPWVPRGGSRREC